MDNYSVFQLFLSISCYKRPLAESVMDIINIYLYGKSCLWETEWQVYM